jgi:hypothetical protein
VIWVVLVTSCPSAVEAHAHHSGTAASGMCTWHILRVGLQLEAEADSAGRISLMADHVQKESERGQRRAGETSRSS